MRLLKLLLWFVVLVAVLFLGIGLLLPRTAHVERSIAIDAPPANVFTLVNSFRRFNEWSPWAARDPGAKYAYEGPDWGVGARMAWTGDPKLVGSGSQEIVASEPYRLVRTRLDFGREGLADAAFTLVPDGPGTRATWSFDTDLGSNPLARWMGLFFDRMIGKDYEAGLSSLRALAERLPRTDVAGIEVEEVTVAPQLIASLPLRAGKESAQISTLLGAALMKLVRFTEQRGLPQAGPPILVTLGADSGGYDLEAALPIGAEPDPAQPPDSTIGLRTLEGGRALRSIHLGPYHTMKASWDRLLAYAALQGYAQAGPVWERYLDDPTVTPESELRTELYVPVK